MRISEMLTSIATWLESPHNEAILLSEYDDNCLNIVANSCIEAAQLLKVAAKEVESVEPPEPSKLTPRAIEELASIASAFDSSGDPELKKQASVIDELLLTIAAPEDALKNRKNSMEDRIDALKKKYEEPRESLMEDIKAKATAKAIEDSKMTKEYRVMQAPLNTRYDPDHPGVMLARVGDGIWQSEMTKKIYDFNEGYTLNTGVKVPGSSISEQTQADPREFHSMFDTREERTNLND